MMEADQHFSLFTHSYSTQPPSNHEEPTSGLGDEQVMDDTDVTMFSDKGIKAFYNLIMSQNFINLDHIF